MMILLQRGGIQLSGSAKVHFPGGHSDNTLSWKEVFLQFSISSFLCVFSCFSVCNSVLKSCLYKLNFYSGQMVYSHLYPFRWASWTCFLNKIAEPWPRHLWNQPFYSVYSCWALHWVTTVLQSTAKAAQPFLQVSLPKAQHNTPCHNFFHPSARFCFSSAWVSAVWCFCHGVYALE